MARCTYGSTANSAAIAIPTPTATVREDRLHGPADMVTPWDGDPGTEGGWGAYLSQMDAMQRWVDGYALYALTQEFVPSLVGSSPTGEVTMFRRATAVDGTKVRLVRIEGGTHPWPGIEASRLAWEFLAGLDQA